VSPRETIASIGRELDLKFWEALGQQVDRSAALSIHQPNMSCIWNAIASVGETARYAR